MADKIEIINTWKLTTIFHELENGNLKIPRFQRGYVWERAKIVKLLNSIYKQYPIGSFFIWEAGAGYAHFSREFTELNLPLVPEYGNYQFILDGQQRITSLYVALKQFDLNNIDYSAICFNIEKKEFKLRTLKSEKHNIPAWKLFDTIAYGDVFAHYMGIDRSLADIWRGCQESFTNYPISIIKSKGMGLEEVVNIFECINQGGKRLSLYDLVHASTWATNFDLREKIKLFNNDANIKHFGEIVPEVFTQSLSLNAFNDCKNKNQLDLNASKCLDIWDSTTRCLRLAIDFVKTLGVRSIEFIPYSSFLSVIQYYFYKSGYTAMKAEHKTFVENWFWTSTFSNRYSSSTLTKMKEDSDWIKGLIDSQLIENAFGVALSIQEIIKIRMNTTSVIKNGILCLYALKHPVDFSNGLSITLDKSYISKYNAKENHHFFPYSLRDRFGTTENGINSIVNLAFISQALNREILNSLPSEYVEKYRSNNSLIDAHLANHFIDKSVLDAIKNNDYSSFQIARAKLIFNRIKEVTAIAAFETTIDDDIVVDIYDDETEVFEEAVNE